jgi:type IV pilus assembly protein PilM
MLTRIAIRPQPNDRPPVAMEISPEGIVAASLAAAGHEPMFAFEPLSHGAILPHTNEPNLHNRGHVVAAIRSTLSRVIQHGRSVTLILPNAAVRVFVLDFETLPSSAADIVAVLRFRLRKMVPFDIEHAALSCQVLSRKTNECRVLITALPATTLDEYESAVREAGFEPGVVLPSSLAALESIGSHEPVLAAFLSGNSLTTSITVTGDLLLYRRVDLPDDADLQLIELQRGIGVALAYFEDKLGKRPNSLQYAGSRPAEGFAASITEPDLTVAELVPRPESSDAVPIIGGSIAGVVGALSRHREHLKVTCNLATRPFSDPEPTLKRLRVAAGALALVACILGGILHIVSRQASDLSARQLALDNDIGRISREHQGYEALMQRSDNAIVISQVRELNRLFDEKAFSWTLAMEDLETVLPAGVQVTALEPMRDKYGQTILKLHILGPRDRAVLVLQNLEHSNRFFFPRLVGESSESRAGSSEKLEPVSMSNLVDFDLLADYLPPGQSDPSTDKATQHSEDRAAPRSVDKSQSRPNRLTAMGAVKPAPNFSLRSGGSK